MEYCIDKFLWTKYIFERYNLTISCCKIYRKVSIWLSHNLTVIIERREWIPILTVSTSHTLNNPITRNGNLAQSAGSTRHFKGLNKSSKSPISSNNVIQNSAKRILLLLLLILIPARSGAGSGLFYNRESTKIRVRKLIGKIDKNDYSLFIYSFIIILSLSLSPFPIRFYNQAKISYTYFYFLQKRFHTLVPILKDRRYSLNDYFSNTLFFSTPNMRCAEVCFYLVDLTTTTSVLSCCCSCCPDKLLQE